jgi:hypothetical protein
MKDRAKVILVVAWFIGMAFLINARACAQTMSVTATVYNAVAGQTDSTPLITASNKKINPESPQRWIAISRDLEVFGFVFDVDVCIEGAGIMNGVWTIQDRMNRRFCRRIDFLVHKNIQLGKWSNVRMSKIDTGCRKKIKSDTG